jgi:CubicO group peptidase (beta-lactamase class C family)
MEGNIGSIEDLYGGKLALSQRINTIRHLDQFFPCGDITPASQPSLIEKNPLNLDGLRFITQDQTLSFRDYIDVNCLAGLCVIKDGIQIFEEYFHGNVSDTPWCAFSVTKSFTSILIGAAIQDGLIRSEDDLVSDYLPQLKDGAYAGVTLKHILRMSSGVSWDETYGDPHSERRQMLEVQHLQKPGAILEFLNKLSRATQPGDQWKYNTGDTFIAGAVLKAAVKKPLSTYLQEKLWQPLGMEFPAYWWLDSPSGQEFGGGGILLKMPDLVRFGCFLLNNGLIKGGRVLPADWMQKSATPFKVQDKLIDYGYLFWLVPEDKGALHQGAFKARGIFGQYLYVNPSQNLVVAAFSARPKPKAADSPIDDDDFLTGLVQYLS